MTPLHHAENHAGCAGAALAEADQQVDTRLAQVRSAFDSSGAEDPSGRKQLEVRHEFWRSELPYHCVNAPNPRGSAATLYREHLVFYPAQRCAGLASGRQREANVWW